MNDQAERSEAKAIPRLRAQVCSTDGSVREIVNHVEEPDAKIVLVFRARSGQEFGV